MTDERKAEIRTEAESILGLDSGECIGDNLLGVLQDCEVVSPGAVAWGCLPSPEECDRITL